MVAKPRSRKEYNNRMNAARTVAKLRAAFFAYLFHLGIHAFRFRVGESHCFMHLKQLFHALETTVSCA